MVENAFDMMWKITVVDIQTTLDEVVNSIPEGHDLARMDPRKNLDNILELDDEFEMPVQEAARRVTKEGNGDASQNVLLRIGTGLGENSTGIFIGPLQNGSKFVVDFSSFLRPKREHSEGKRMHSREDVLHARATGLRRFGRILMRCGQSANEAGKGAENVPRTDSARSTQSTASED